MFPLLNRVNDNNVKTNSIVEIVDYLNQKIGSKYKATTNKTKSCIQARINEGFSIDDFKHVINAKSKEWLGTDYEKYLRPETLFGNKFEGYLNQQPKQQKQSSNTPKMETMEDLPDWYKEEIKEYERNSKKF